jgi:integrase
MPGTLEQREHKGIQQENPQMTQRLKQRRRPYGSGCVIEAGRGLAIRWWEKVVGLDGQPKWVRRYEALGAISRKKAGEILNEKLRESRQNPKVERPTVTFREHAERWRRDILPTYKHSVQLGHGCILDGHLLPKFGPRPIAEITTMEIQSWVSELRQHEFWNAKGEVTRVGYAPHSIDHFHEVLNAVMRVALEWYKLPANPARGVRIGRVKPVRKKWALTPSQAGQLLSRLALKARAMVAMDIVTGLRRGELEAVRWEDLNETDLSLTVKEAHCRGHLDDPKTEAGFRTVAVPEEVLVLVRAWKARAKRTKATDFVFGTREGKPENANNILRRHVYPACDALGIPRANWLTFRRTFSTWSHKHGVPPKDLAELMGHANVDMQFEYAVGMDANKQAAAAKLGKELVSFGHILPMTSEIVN